MLYCLNSNVSMFYLQMSKVSGVVVRTIVYLGGDVWVKWKEMESILEFMVFRANCTILHFDKFQSLIIYACMHYIPVKGWNNGNKVQMVC